MGRRREVEEENLPLWCQIQLIAQEEAKIIMGGDREGKTEIAAFFLWETFSL